MPLWNLERKLVAGLVALFLIPAAVGAATFLLLDRAVAGPGEPSAVAVTVTVALVTSTICVGAVAWVVGRRLVRAVDEIRGGTELMATVNPEHRLSVRGGGELGALADEVNRLADRLKEARSGLERDVARATRELVVERGTLSAVLEALGEGVAVATREGRITLANRAAHGLLGAQLGGLLGRSLFDFVDREKLAHFFDRLSIAEDTSERFRLYPAGGAVLDTVMTPFFDGEGRMIGFILVLRDATRPARTDEERQRLVTKTLHELRGSLASVRSLSESLLGDASLGDTVHRLLGAIHAEALRLSRLVGEMSEPGRLGLARLPWHFETLAFPDLAAMTLRRLQREGEGRAEVRVEDDPSSLPLKAEASALSGALGHLLGTVLARRQPAGRVWLRTRRRGRVLQVDAGGEGRAPVTELEPLLDAPLSVGLGGQVTVREIVQRHAGEVWAYEDGSRFGFMLTLPSGEPAEATRDSREADPASGARFIGAGLISGFSGTEDESERPDFYDFSLFEEMERHVMPADRERRLDELHYVALDIETTGLRPEDGDRMVSIAGVRVRGGAVKRGEVFDALVNPRRRIPAGSVKFHGITDALVAEAPPIDVVLPAFLRFAEGAVLVGYQVWFDVRFLGIEAARLGLPPITLVHPVLDTLLLSELVHGSLPDHRLDAVAGRLGVIVRGRHSAMGDALATADIFVRLVELLKKRGIVTLGQALDAVRERQGSRVDGDATPGAGP